MRYFRLISSWHDVTAYMTANSRVFILKNEKMDKMTHYAYHRKNKKFYCVQSFLIFYESIEL